MKRRKSTPRNAQRAAAPVSRSAGARVQDNSATLSNHGTALCELKRFRGALASFDRALELSPGFAPAHYNRGIALNGLERFEEAVTSYDRAIAIVPDFADALYNRGNALPDFDFHTPLLSLPLAFDTQLDSIPADIPYLRANPEKVAAWSVRLGKRRAPRIGIA